MLKKIIKIFFEKQNSKSSVKTIKRSQMNKNDEQKFLLINKKVLIDFDEREKYYKKAFILNNQL